MLSVLFKDSEVSPEDLSSLDEFTSVSYDIDGTKTIFTLSATVEGVTEKIIITIENNKLLELALKSEGEGVSVSFSKIFAYGEEAVTMKALPEDADSWTLETEDE